MKRRFTYLSLAQFVFIVSIFAQPGAVDLTFTPQVVANDILRAIALQPDGKIIVGEKHGTIPNAGTSRVKRLLPDGKIDTTFQYWIETNGIIRRVAVQSDGKIVLAGEFSTYNSIPMGYIARLNADGSTDTTFKTGAGFNNSVYALALQPDGKIVVGGLFTSYNGTPCNRLARLNADGSYDTSFNTTIGANGSIEDLVIQPDGKIVIGGDFTAYEGVSTFRVTRVNIDGSIDNTWLTPSGASAVVYALALQPDGKILAGGNFSQYNLQNKSKLVRLHATGDIDASFAVGTSANAEVRTIAVLNTGEVLVAGGFTTFKGIPTNRIAKVSDICTIDPNFLNGNNGADETIYSILVQPNGKLLVSGYFQNFNNVPVPRIARLYNCLTPQPDSIYGNSYALCSGTSQLYSITPVTGATKYEWTLPSGWQGDSDSASILAISNGGGGVIAVKAFTDSCGWSYATTREIATMKPAGVDICLVTVDSQSTHNIVVWEKPQNAVIDSFFIYRETANNVYTKIGAVGYNDLSEFHDYAANPNITSYRYKLSVLDTCGAESALSPYHNTIHLQNLGNGNFQWTFYQIENSGNPVNSFNMNRDPFGNSNFFPIGLIPGTNATFTDINHSSFPDAQYMVDVNWNISCTPSRAVSTTRSNIRRLAQLDTSLLSTNETAFQQIEIFPNPAGEIIYIRTPENVKIQKLQLLNMAGQVVRTATEPTYLLHVGMLPKGIYTLSIETESGNVKKKIAIE